jgi:hypothetical protein
MEKFPLHDICYTFPTAGEKLEIPLKAETEDVCFKFSLYKGSRNILKCTYQTGYENYPLLRLDLNSSHKNPDGEIIKGTHLHIYRWGYADKFACRLPFEGFFVNTENIYETLKEFMRFSKISAKLRIQPTLENYL